MNYSMAGRIVGESIEEYSIRLHKEADRQVALETERQRERDAEKERWARMNAAAIERLHDPTETTSDPPSIRRVRS